MRVQAAANLGVDPQAVYRLAALDEHRFDDVDARLSLDEENAIWRAIVALTGDDHVGLRLGRSLHLAALGLLGYVLMNAETLEQCFRKFCRYERVVADTYHHAFDVDGELARYTMESLGPWHVERKHTLDLSIIGIVYQRAFPVADLHFGCERTEIAYLLGFSEVGSFSRSFRRWTGETPTSYRRAVEA